MGVEEKMSALSIMFDDKEVTSQYLDAVTREKQRLSAPLGETHDALALSWASYRKFNDTGIRWSEWDSADLLSIDHEMAQATRQYYRNRITVQALKGRDITKFQQELHDVCNGAPLQLKHKGMLWRLPYFYHEDITRDQLRQQFTKEIQPQSPGTATVTLKPVSRIFKSRRQQEMVEYWFEADDQLYMMDVQYRNDYRPMLDGLFERDQVCITAIMICREILGVKHYGMARPVLAT